MRIRRDTIAVAALVAGCIETTLANPLNQRQDSSSASSQSSSSKLSTSVSGSTSAKAAATPSGTASKTPSTLSASETTLSGTATPTLSTEPGGATVTRFQTLPQFTTTVTHAYKAHGVNATFNSTFSHTGTVTTGTATDLSPGAILGTAGPQPTGKEISDIPDDKIACRINGTDPKQGPFCTPEHDQNLWVNNIYAVSWNPDLFQDPHAANHIEIHNANTTSTDPKDYLIYNSTLVPNEYGFLNIYMNHDWLGDHSGNYTRDGVNMTFVLFSQPNGAPLNQSSGPITTLTLNPHSLPRLKIPNPIPTRKGFEIGLPIGLVAVLIVALSIWCGIRRHRQKWSSMRHYGKDYMRKRAQKKGKKDVIELSDYDFDSSTRADKFEDEPTVGGRRQGGNEFREEMERQREQAYRDRAQKITSF